MPSAESRDASGSEARLAGAETASFPTNYWHVLLHHGRYNETLKNCHMTALIYNVMI